MPLTEIPEMGVTGNVTNVEISDRNPISKDQILPCLLMEQRDLELRSSEGGFMCY